MRRYYIESKRDGKVLREFSVVCNKDELNLYREHILFSSQGIADITTIYSHDGLNNSHTIEIVEEIFRIN